MRFFNSQNTESVSVKHMSVCSYVPWIAIGKSVEDNGAPML